MGTRPGKRERERERAMEKKIAMLFRLTRLSRSLLGLQYLNM